MISAYTTEPFQLLKIIGSSIIFYVAIKIVAPFNNSQNKNKTENTTVISLYLLLRAWWYKRHATVKGASLRLKVNV